MLSDNNYLMLDTLVTYILSYLMLSVNNYKHNHLPVYLVHHLQANPVQHISAHQSLDSFILSATYPYHHLPVQHGHFLPEHQGPGLILPIEAFTFKMTVNHYYYFSLRK